jgi:ABC-2 type transport system ATP-binding protein
MIQLTSVSKSFDNKLVLDHIDWTVKKGSVFGLVGPNGAGKSTLLRIISGVIKADNGQVTVDGEFVYDEPLVKKAHSIFSR